MGSKAANTNNFGWPIILDYNTTSSIVQTAINSYLVLTVLRGPSFTVGTKKSLQLLLVVEVFSSFL